MKIERVRRKKTDKFTTIDNTIIRDENVSLKAKAVLLIVMGLPDDWDFSINGMVAVVKEGRAAVYSAINELIAARYAERYEVREKGRFSSYGYTFYERPLPHTEKPLTEKPYTVNPQTVKPQTDEPYTEKPQQLKKQLINDLTNQETINVRDQKIEISTTIATNIEEGKYDPAGMLFDAFPQCQFQPTDFGFIESSVRDVERDRESWRLTIEKYQMNFNPRTKAYIPTKISNVLDTFRAIRDRLPEPKQTDVPEWKDALNQQAEICKPVYVG